MVYICTEDSGFQSLSLARSRSLALVSCFRPISVPHPVPLPLPLPLHLRLPALSTGMSVLERGFIEKKKVSGLTQMG